MATIPTIEQNDNAATLRRRVNAAINAVNSGSTPSGGGGSSDGSDSTDRVLNILNIGNSHTEDAWMYVPYMLLEYGIKVRMAIWRANGIGIGGKGINACYTTPRTVADDETGVGQAGKIYFIDTTGESGSEWMVWKTVLDAREGTTYASDGEEDYTVQEAVKLYDIKWDLVTLQGNYNDMTSNYVPDQTSHGLVMKKIAADLPVTPLFGLQIVHTSGFYSDMGFMFASLANHHNIFSWAAYDLYFPSGTAIANARQFTEITSVCSAATLLQDGIHLEEGLPCYIASLACIESLFRKFYPQLTIIGDPTRVSSEWKTGKVIIAQQPASGNSIPTSEDNALLAQRLAVLANDHPWDITASSAEPIKKRETVTFAWNLPTGLCLDGALYNAGSTGSHNTQLQKHSYLGGKVRLASGYEGTITSVIWTMNGATHEAIIENNQAYVLIKDICSTVTLTATADGLQETQS